MAVQGPNGEVESGKQKAEARIQTLEAVNAEVKARQEKLERLWLYGLTGMRQPAIQLSPWSVGGAWLVLAACLLLPFLLDVVVLGFMWGCWHIQNYVSLDPVPVFMDPFPRTEVIVLLFTSMLYSVIPTSVYDSTGGSMFAVVVLHRATVAGGNLYSWNELQQQSATPYMWLGRLPWLVIVAGLVWRYGATNLSWRDRVVAEPPKPALQPDSGRDFGFWEFTVT